MQFSSFFCLPVLLASAAALPAQSSVRAWGNFAFDTECNQGITVQVKARDDGTLVRRADGLVFGQGSNTFGLASVPIPPPGTHYTDIACGNFGMALRSDGALVGWGNIYSVIPYYPPPPLLPTQYYVAIDCSRAHAVALISDGSIVAWGFGADGQCDVPALPAGLTYTSVACGGNHSVAMRSDGSVVAWGYNDLGQCNVVQAPTGLHYVQIATGSAFSLALCNDGSIVSWGSNSYGQRNVPNLPPGVVWTKVACGTVHALGLRSDGILMGWGYNYAGQANPPSPPAGLGWVDFGGGYSHSIGLLSNGKTVGWGDDFHSAVGVPELAGGTRVIASSSRSSVTPTTRAIGSTAEPASRSTSFPLHASKAETSSSTTT